MGTTHPGGIVDGKTCALGFLDLDLPIPGLDLLSPSLQACLLYEMGTHKPGTFHIQSPYRPANVTWSSTKWQEWSQLRDSCSKVVVNAIVRFLRTLCLFSILLIKRMMVPLRRKFIR